METNETTTKTLTGLVSVLAVLLLAGGIFFWKKKAAFKLEQVSTQQRVDSLLTAQLRLKEDMSELTNQLASSKADNTDLNTRLGDANQQLNRTDARLRDLRRTSAGRQQKLKQLDESNYRLTVIRDSLGAQMEAMHDKINWQTKENETLTSQNTNLQQQLTNRDARLLTMVPRSALTSDAFRVEVSKPNRKETAKAKKADVITVSFTIPAELALSGMQRVYVSLTDSQRVAMVDPQKLVTIALPDQQQTIPVHAERTVNFARNPQRLSVDINPESGVKPGIYRASVFTDNAYLGSVEFRLRDSFWFF